MVSIKEKYVSTLQNFMRNRDIQASTWTFRTIKDLGSVLKKSDVLTFADRVAIAARGALALLIFLPVNVIAIPHTFILGAVHKRYQLPEPMPQLHKIIDGVYLGTVQAATSEQTLKDHKIGVVVSILDDAVEVSEEFAHLHLEVDDSPHVDLKETITKVITFLEESVGDNVLIHCNMGQSRSASVTTAVVMHKQGISGKEALDLVEKQRSVVSLNYGFKKQIMRLKPGFFKQFQ